MKGQPTKEKHPWIIYFLTVSATLGGFLFGYDTAIINGALILIKEEYSLTTGQSELIVASTVGAAAVFSLFSGVVADAIGRKTTIMISSMIFIVGGAVMGMATGVNSILIGRITVGAAIGFVSSVVPIYISECSPSDIRGILITMHQLFITIGIVVASVFAGAFQFMENGWRLMLGISVVPGIIQFLAFLTLPESPRYQVRNNQFDQAERTLKQIRSKSDVTTELNEIKHSLEEEQGSKGWIIWKRIMTTPHVRKALFIGCMLQVFQQFCGINAVIYYSSTILMSAGFNSSVAIWLAVIPASINFLATFIGLWAVETLGRKLVLAFSFLAIGVALLVLCAGFLLSQVNSPEAKFTNDFIDIRSHCTAHTTCHECIETPECGYCYFGDVDHVKSGACVRVMETDNNFAAVGRCSRNNFTLMFETKNVQFTFGFCPTRFGWLAVVGMVLFVLGFAPGAGPMPWTINAEIYPQWGRSIANSLATVTNWVCCVILSYYFLTLISLITAWGTFLLFCVVCIVGAIFVLLFVPETKDKSLEEIEILFMSDEMRTRTMLNRQKVDAALLSTEQSMKEASKRHSWIEPSFLPNQSGSTTLI